MIKYLLNGNFQSSFEGKELGEYNTYELAYDAWANYCRDNDIIPNRFPQIVNEKEEFQKQIQANEACCLATAFAMVLNIKQEFIFEQLGHNGTQIIWPDKIGNKKYRGFHPQELIDIADQLGRTVTPFEAMPTINSDYKCQDYVVYFKNQTLLERIEKILNNNKGVLTGETLYGVRHAVAWIYGKIYDPNGIIYELDQFNVETFWRIK